MCVRTITLVLAWCVSASGRRCLGPPEVVRPLDRNFSTCGGAPPSVWRDAAPYPETSCAFCAGNAATAHLLEIAAELRRLKARECRRLVVYGAAFGTRFFRRWPNRTLAGARTVQDLHGAHGQCFFKFILKKDVTFVRKRVGTNTLRLPPSLFVRTNFRVEGLDLLVPLDQDALPWLATASLRRNVKILKMLGQRLFPWTERLLWIDAKLRLGATNPLRLFDATEARGACLAAVGLPFHNNAYGPGAAAMRVPSFSRHGATVVRSLAMRPLLTDNVRAVEAQMGTYVREHGSPALSRDLIDSAYLVRDLRSPRCRSFNAALGCAWFEEITCWSDRDQLSFPYALRRLGLSATAPRRPALDSVVVRSDRGSPVALILPPGRPSRGDGPVLHWYYTHALAVGKCLPCVRDRRDPFAASFDDVEIANAAAPGSRPSA
mmetsp:Transcript_17295/g.49395  ORF Transcript_17295/g.49395 Transcript_17295/m.49395 type:complete len:434 (+) Transcript_17295:114-1415(+)